MGNSEAKATSDTATEDRLRQIETLQHVNLGTTDLAALTKAFCRKLNLELRRDKELGSYIPLDLSYRSSEDLLNKISDGLILCKLMNKIEIKCIEDRLIHKRNGMDVHQKTENVRRAVGFLQTLKVDVAKVDVDEVVARR
jgi:hypothetical protein